MAWSLGEADLARLRRAGSGALSDERGLALFDAALAADHSPALAVPIDTAGLRSLAAARAPPPIFSGLNRMPKRRSAVSRSLAAKLTALSAVAAEGPVLGLVPSKVAARHGH